MIFFLLIVVIFLFSSMKIVPHNEVIIIERLGKLNKVLNPGLNFIFPFIDAPKKFKIKSPSGDETLTTNISLREQVYDYSAETLITRDNVISKIDILIYFNIDAPVKAAYEVDSVPTAIDKLMRNTMRSIVAQINWSDLISQRSEMRKKLENTLFDSAASFGVKINRVEILDIKSDEASKQMI
jgi:regulator of protease activity HflC (stomatin/prohibitin superfamily)